MTPIAHAGHWLANTLYALPAIVLVLALVRQRVRERRGSAGSGREPDPPA